MANTPIPTITYAAVQYAATGAVDYLKFDGSNLVGSDLHDYGLGSDWKIVAHGDFNDDFNQDLLAQNQATGAVEFLYLDAHANLLQTFLNNVSLPKIVGAGAFNGAAPVVVSQLPDGSLDMLGFNSSGTLVHTDLVPSTVGFGPVVGVGGSFDIDNLFFTPALAGVGAIFNENVVLQTSAGLDVIGFTGNFADFSLQVTATNLLAGTAGLPPVGAINQTGDSLDLPYNLDYMQVTMRASNSTYNAAAQALTQLPNGQLDALYFNSGYFDPANEGLFYASNLYAPSFAGANIVDASDIAGKVFS